MAEPNPASAEPASAPAPPAAGGLMRKLLPPAIILAVVLAECLIAYSFLPSGTQPATAAQVIEPAAPAKAPAETRHEAKHEAKHEGKSESKSEGKSEGKHEGKHGGGEKATKEAPLTADLVEVDLGQFTVTSVQPGSSTTLRIAFRLFGTVSGLDKERFDTRMKEAQHRFREQVILAIRAAETTDLTEPGLGLIKRTILEKTNALLGEPLLKAVVVSEFSFMEV